MRLAHNPLLAMVLLLHTGILFAQATPAAGAHPRDQLSVSSGSILQQLPLRDQAAIYSLTPAVASPLQPLIDFKETEIKFNLQTLMSTLKDNRHEGWVLAAYPDPKTSRPLIGAGFSLDLPERAHPQDDLQNPVPFLEPSSAQLWQAAGLDPQHLQTMLEQYDRDLSVWRKRNFQRKARTGSLFPQISEEDATKLLRISTIQAIHNSRAYCRYFDQLSGSQQMALTQLVFQMGVNLEEFTQFLAAINERPGSVPAPVSAQNVKDVSDSGSGTAVPATFHPDSSNAQVSVSPETEYWKSVQETLIHSDWARRYSERAIAVIAMFDPGYATDPWEAEAKVRAQVRPLHHHHRRRHASSVRTTSASHGRSSSRTHKS